MSMDLEWSGIEGMVSAMTAYERQVVSAVEKVADYWRVALETEAKRNARWTDRTGLARQSLHTFTQTLAQNTVELYLAHGVDYGTALELKFAGRYAIVWETIQDHLGPILQMLQGIFGSENVSLTG